MAKNWQLLREVREYIDAHPEDWFQQDWRCSSGLCFAGTAVALDGGIWFTLSPSAGDSEMLVAREDDDPVASQTAWLTLRDPGFDEDRWIKGLDDQTLPMLLVSARDRAMRILGLDDDEASILFDGGNDKHLLDEVLVEFASYEDWTDAYVENDRIDAEAMATQEAGV